MKKLFISYTYSGNGVSGNGNCEINVEDEETAENMEDIRSLQSQIEEQLKIKGVIINNIIRFPIG